MGRTCNTHMVMMDTKFQSEDPLHSLGPNGTEALRRILKNRKKGAQDRVQWLCLVNAMQLALYGTI